MRQLFALIPLLFSKVNGYTRMVGSWNTRQVDINVDVYMNNKPITLQNSDIIEGVANSANEWNQIENNDININFYGILYGTRCPDFPNEYSGLICFKYDTMYPAQTFFFPDLDAEVKTGFIINIDPFAAITREMFYNLMLHEFGHVNLLGHNGDLNTVMGHVMQRNLDGTYPTTYKILELAEDDKRGVSERCYCCVEPVIEPVISNDYPMLKPVDVPVFGLNDFANGLPEDLLFRPLPTPPPFSFFDIKKDKKCSCTCFANCD